MFEITSICKGGGYHYCRTNPPHPKANSNGLYPLHRVLIENKIGRLLLPGEIVHHQDEDKYNDSIENLILENNAEHSSHHARDRGEIFYLQCYCGKEFTLKRHQYKQRLQRSKTKQLYCSRSCATKYFKTVFSY